MSNEDILFFDYLRKNGQSRMSAVIYMAVNTPLCEFMKKTEDRLRDQINNAACAITLKYSDDPQVYDAIKELIEELFRRGNGRDAAD